jgi:hypothetical protein
MRKLSRGAVAVEAALVTPLLLLMVFGIIEMAFLMKDDVALTSAVRTGGRTASASAGAGPAGVDADGDCVAPCSAANTPRLAQLAANAIQKSGSALPQDSIQELWIYKANDKGYPGGTGATAWTCSTDCIRYRWVGAKNQFRYYSGTWQSASIAACANSSPDSVGIYMKAKHRFLTGLFFHDVDIDDHAVFAFEPLPSLSCAAGSHP